MIYSIIDNFGNRTDYPSYSSFITTLREMANRGIQNKVTVALKNADGTAVYLTLDGTLYVKEIASETGQSRPIPSNLENYPAADFPVNQSTLKEAIANAATWTDNPKKGIDGPTVSQFYIWVSESVRFDAVQTAAQSMLENRGFHFNDLRDLVTNYKNIVESNPNVPHFGFSASDSKAFLEKNLSYSQALNFVESMQQRENAGEGGSSGAGGSDSGSSSSSSGSSSSGPADPGGGVDPAGGDGAPAAGEGE